MALFASTYDIYITMYIGQLLTCLNSSHLFSYPFLTLIGSPDFLIIFIVLKISLFETSVMHCRIGRFVSLYTNIDPQIVNAWLWWMAPFSIYKCCSKLIIFFFFNHSLKGIWSIISSLFITQRVYFCWSQNSNLRFNQSL